MKIDRTPARRLLLPIAICAVALTGFTACGDDKDDDAKTPAATAAASATSAATGDEAAVEATIVDAYAAWNAKDAAKLLPYFTDSGVVAVLGSGDGTAEEVRAMVPNYIGEPQIESRGFANTKVDGTNATTDSAELQNVVLANVRYTLVKVGDAWKVDGQEYLPTPLPAGATAVNVDLNEFAFGADLTPLTTAKGAISLEAKNVGTQKHELLLAKIPAEADVQQLLMSEDDPGFEVMGAAGPIAPGDSLNLVYIEPLKPGRYVMACFLPDTSEGAEGTPHAFKGMTKEFTIP